MACLDTTSKSLTIELTGSPTTQAQWTVHYATRSGTDFAESSNDGVTNSTTPVTMIAAPVSGETISIRDITVYNADVSSVTIVIKLVNGGNSRVLYRQTLDTLESWSSLAQKGKDGAQGLTGSVSAASGLILDESSAPNTATNQGTLYVPSSDNLLRYRGESNGTERRIALIDTTNLATNDLFYYGSDGLFKRIAIGTLDQVLVAKPSSNPPYQWATSTGGIDTLTANRTYYVRTDGSDSNNGLTNTAGGAFLTVQKAVDVAASVFWAGYNVDIQLGDGDYQLSAPIVLKRGVGSGILTIKGNSSNIQAVRIKGVVSGGVNQTFVAMTLLSNIADIIVQDLEFLDLQIAVLDNSYSSSLTLQNISYKNISNRAIYLAYANSLCLVRGANNRFEKTTTNSNNFAMTLAPNATIDFNKATITMVGNPVFSKWLECYRMSIANLVDLKILGSYTGGYTAGERSRIYTSGATGIGSGNTVTGGDIF